MEKRMSSIVECLERTLVRDLSGHFFLGHSWIKFSANEHSSPLLESVPAVGMFPMALYSHFRNGLTDFSRRNTTVASIDRVYRTSDWLQVASLSDQNQALAFTPDGHQWLRGIRQIQFLRVSDWTLQLFYDRSLATRTRCQLSPFSEMAPASPMGE